MSTNDSLDSRGFMTTMSATGLTLTAATYALAAKTGSKMSGGRVIGANDRINIGVIGCGGRGSYDADAFSAFGKKHDNACQIVAVCDVYEKRKKMVAIAAKTGSKMSGGRVIGANDRINIGVIGCGGRGR